MYPFDSVKPDVSLAIGITVNSLIVLKSFLDPIIYTARMKEMKQAFQRMRHQIISRLCKRKESEEATMMQFNQSVLLHHNSHDQSPVNVRQSLRFNRSSTQSRTQQPQSQIGSDLTPTDEQSHCITALATVNEVEQTP